MNRHVVDTSLLIDHPNRRREVKEALERLAGESEGLYASVLTKIEVLAGMLSSEVEATRRLFTLFRWVSVDDPIAERAGDLSRRYRRRFPGIDLTDYVIAATAEILQATLVTRNIKHFPMVTRAERP